MGQRPSSRAECSAPATPAGRAADLQRRVRRVNRLLNQGEAYHVELDAIASELGVLAMDLESYEPAGRVWRAAQR